MNIFNKCTATLNQASILIPEKPESLFAMCVFGAQKLGIDLSDPVYAERLDTELQTIADKKFEDYFYLVADLMQWAKANQTVGPGRGSSAGSLVCYLLGITQIDPIKYGLLFFRFIDPERPDFPDIDMDFADRDAAIEYLMSKYGRERVAKLGTVGNWQAKNTSNEVCKALSIPFFEADSVLNTIPKYAAGDDRNDTALKMALENTPQGKAFIEKYPGYIAAAKMTGSPRNAGVHAGGVILTNDPIANFVAIDSRSDATQCNMVAAEELGLLKLDCLGLKTLTVVEDTLKLAGLPRDYLETIPLDDQAAFDVLNKGHFLGVFQFDGYALRKLTKTMHVSRFDDLAILSALSRPGASVGADAWVRRRNGQEEVSYPHEVLEPYLKETLGTLVYQETVMQIAHYVAGLDWGKVAKLRKAIGKSLGDEAMAEYAEPFISGLVAKGVGQEIAEKFWNDILGFASYSFNKSHTIAYGLVSYWTCYLKAHFPLEFAAASLTQQPDHEAQLEFLRELDGEGVGYVPIDAEYSTDKWRVANGKLVGPLSLVPGLGPKLQAQILSARSRGEPLPDRAQKLLADPKTKIDSLYPIKDALVANGLLEKPYALSVRRAVDMEPNGDWIRDFYVAGLVVKMQIQDENDEKRIADRIARGYEGRKQGQSKFIEIRLADDSGTCYVKIPCKSFLERKDALMANIEVGKTLIVASGTVPPQAPILLNENVWKIGEME